ncbi:MAG: patatin-like phospholipase family protein [Gemmobacter sp.]|nr:patatin-like phospholipase family protein [Gemmobacter sp.]
MTVKTSGPPDTGFAARDVAVVLAGGNALGAYHSGACAALTDSGLTPNWYIGTSIGAITGAILLGNPPETRFARLEAFWRQAAQPTPPGLHLLPEGMRARIGNDYGLATLLAGRPGLFGARWPGVWSVLPFLPPDTALRDHRPMRRTLERLIDFDRLNNGEARLSVMALDLETGEDVWFDTASTGVHVDHLLAATALVPLFPAVSVEGRNLCDGGLANNLALDRVLRADLDRPLLCLACDLFNPRGPAPQSLDQAVTRVQDLAFSVQTRRALAALVTERELRHRLNTDLPHVLLGLMSYVGAGSERSLKALDFSRARLADRAACGRRDMAVLLGRLREAPQDTGPTTVVTLDDVAKGPPHDAVA